MYLERKRMRILYIPRPTSEKSQGQSQDAKTCTSQLIDSTQEKNAKQKKNKSLLNQRETKINFNVIITYR